MRVLQGLDHGPTLVFARTRAGCAEVADALSEQGFDADALHGDLSQAARETVLRRFRAGRVRVLVATDVAARGLDIQGVTHVVNLDVPPDPASYVHRIGRTGRAGADGTAITFVAPAERPKLRHLMRVLRSDIEEVRVPTVAMVARLRQSRLQQRLVDAAPSGDARAWFAAACEDTGMSPEELGAAALALLAAQQGVDLAPPPASRPERADRERVDDDEVKLFLGVGHRHGVRPQDLVGALTRGRGVDGRAVGRITILEAQDLRGAAAGGRGAAAGRGPAAVDPGGNDVRMALARSGSPAH
ncbi:MAG: C-terminal helicase domain-containing protein [Myxococcota bacterium]